MGKTHAELAEALSRTEIFKDVDPDSLREIAAIAQEREFEKDTLIVCESDQGRELCIVLTGRVSIEMEMPLPFKGQGRLAIIGRGEVFGEMSCVTGLPRSATARTLEQTRVLVIEGTALDRFFAQHRDVGYGVIRGLFEVLCRRLESTNLMWRNAVADLRAQSYYLRQPSGLGGYA